MEINGIQEKDKAYQIIPIKIVAAGQSVPVNTETKMEHESIVGIFGSTTSEFGIIGSTMNLTIDDKEVFPDGFEVSLIHRQNGVSINDLPYKLKRRALNSKIKLTYVDGKNINTVYPYTFSLYLQAIKSK